jgi:hypothetical protein
MTKKSSGGVSYDSLSIETLRDHKATIETDIEHHVDRLSRINEAIRQALIHDTDLSDEEVLKRWEQYWDGWDRPEIGIDLPDGTEEHGFLPTNIRYVAHRILVLAAQGKVRLNG